MYVNLLIAFIHFNILFHFFFHHSQPVFVWMTDVEHLPVDVLNPGDGLIPGADNLDSGLAFQEIQKFLQILHRHGKVGLIF